MKNQNYQITLNDRETQQQIELMISQDLKIGEILEINESIANYFNKSSGKISELEIYSKSINSIVSLNDSIGEILKDKKFDELEIRNRFSQSYSELQVISVRIKFSHNNAERCLKLSRFDQLSQIADEILKSIEKTRDEYPLQFYIKGQFYNPFKVNLSLADINFIDNDEILITIPIRVSFKIYDGPQAKMFQAFFQKCETLLDVEKKIQDMIEEYKYAKLTFEIDNKICDQQKTVQELNISESTIISVKIRWQGGFQRQ